MCPAERSDSERGSFSSLHSCCWESRREERTSQRWEGWRNIVESEHFTGKTIQYQWKVNLLLLPVFLRTTKGGASFRGFMIMAEVGGRTSFGCAQVTITKRNHVCSNITLSRCTETAATATLCRLPSQKTSLVVLIDISFILSHKYDL